MKSFIRLFARIDRKYIGLAHFNNVYVRFSPGPMPPNRTVGPERNEQTLLNWVIFTTDSANKRMNDFISTIRLATK